MALSVPPPTQPLTAAQTGMITEPWYRFMAAALTLSDAATAGYALIGNGSGATFEGFQRSETGALERTWQSKVQERGISAKDFGALGDGTTDDSAAFIAAVAAASEYDPIIIPPGVYNIDSNIPQSDPVWWIKDFGATFPAVGDPDKLFGGTNVNRPQDVSGFFASASAICGSFRTNEYAFAEFQSLINSTPASGGSTPYERGWLYQSLVQHDVSSSAALDLVNMDLRNLIPGSNSHGSIWNLYLRCTVDSGGDGEVNGIELEVLNSGSGVSTPETSLRKYAYMAQNFGTVPATCAYILRGSASGAFYKGFYCHSNGLANDAASSFLEYSGKFRVDYDGNLSIGSNAVNTNPLYIEANTALTNLAKVTTTEKHKTSGTATVGFAIAHHVILENGSGSDVTAAVETYQWLDATAGSEDSELDLQVRVAGAMASRIKVGNGMQIGAPTGGYAGVGTLNLDVALYVDGTKVVGARDTGFAAMTGSADEGSTYDTATVTLPQLAGRVMALQAALTTHGLIGT